MSNTISCTLCGLAPFSPWRDSEFDTELMRCEFDAKIRVRDHTDSISSDIHLNAELCKECRDQYTPGDVVLKLLDIRIWIDGKSVGILPEGGDY